VAKKRYDRVLADVVRPYRELSVKLVITPDGAEYALPWDAVRAPMVRGFTNDGTGRVEVTVEHNAAKAVGLG